MTNAIDDRPRTVALVVVLLVTGSALVPMGVASAAQNDPPAPPASYYGTVEDEGGGQPADGTTIVAVGYDADGDVIEQDSIDVQDGQYGGSGGFDDKLRIPSNAARVAFYVGERNGTELTPTDENPESGVHERALTAEGEVFGGTITTPTPNPTETPAPTSTRTATPVPTGTSTDSQAGAGGTNDDTDASGETNSGPETESGASVQTQTATSTGSPSDAGPATATRTTATTDGASATGGGGGLPIDERGLAVAMAGLLGVLAIRHVGLDDTVAAVRAIPATLAGLVPFGTDDAAAAGTVGIRNETDREVSCQVRCRTTAETVFLERLSLAAGDGGALADLPDEPFEVAVSVQNGPTEKRTFRNFEETDDVMVRLTPTGIQIG